jgi:hypothetical protein
VLDSRNPSRGIAVKKKAGDVPNQPWTAKTVPLSLRAKARKIPQWQLDSRGMAGALQMSPVRSAEPIEEVNLIPMGAARLRISAFPVVGEGSDAREWTAIPTGITSSHCNDSDSEEAIRDGVVPQQPQQVDLPRFTWWDHRGTAEWIEYMFPSPRKVSGVRVYWFQDTHLGRHCAVPQKWQLLYRKGNDWLPVPNPTAFGTEAGKFNQTRFDPVECTGLRIEAQLQPNLSSGIIEWAID